MPARVFVGHGPETVGSDQKQQLASQFFKAETDDQWRRALLAEYNIRYLYFGPNERTLGDFSPDKASYLTQKYDNGSVQIYEVTSTP